MRRLANDRPRLLWRPSPRACPEPLAEPWLAALRLMRWRSVKVRPAQRARCTRSGAKVNHGTSVRTTPWVTTCSGSRRRVIQRRGMTRDHHLTRQPLEQIRKRDRVGLRGVEAIAPDRPPGRLQIRRIAVNQFPAGDGNDDRKACAQPCISATGWSQTKASSA